MTDVDDRPPREVELKLHFQPEQRSGLEAIPVLRRAPAETRHEITTYYDTDQLDLMRQGVSLRVRQSGGRFIQTLKTPDQAAGIASTRGEWEWDIDGGDPEITLLSGTPRGDLVATLGVRVQPFFVTDIHRTVRMLAVGRGTKVEAAIDEGRIVANNHAEPVNELELELKQGTDLGAIYRLALSIHSAVPLSVAGESKAARGFRLFGRQGPATPKAGKVVLPQNVRIPEALSLIVGATLSHLVANTAAAEQGAPEGIHQARVALRRLRAALVLFKRQIEPRTAEAFGDCLRTLGQILGEARDWDVFAFETMARAAADHPSEDWPRLLREVALEKRAAVDGVVTEVLLGSDFTKLVLAMAAWIESRAFLAGPHADKVAHARLNKVGPDLLDRMAAKARERGRHITRLGEEELHALRKAMKKLRYSVEFLERLFDVEEVHAYRKHCEELQELLGSINDAHATMALVGSLARHGDPDLVAATEALGSWCDTRRAEAIGKLEPAWQEFRAAEPFWD